DTNILSELARIHPSSEVVLRFHSAVEEELHTSSVCIEEIRYGCAALPNSAERWQKLYNLVLWRVKVLGFENETAILAGDLRAEWKKKGTPVGYKDGLIAATARLTGLTV